MKLLLAALPFCLALLIGEISASTPSPQPSELKRGAVVYAANCATCHDPSTEWTQGGCRPASLAGLGGRIEKAQFLNLLNTGVAQMPSFAHLPTADRSAAWTYLSSLPAAEDAGPAPSSYCRKVQAALAGETQPTGPGCGAGAGCQGKGCEAQASRPESLPDHDCRLRTVSRRNPGKVKRLSFGR